MLRFVGLGLVMMLVSCLGKTELGGTAKPTADKKPETSKASTAKVSSVDGHYLSQTLNVVSLTPTQVCKDFAQALKSMWASEPAHQMRVLWCENAGTPQVNCELIAVPQFLGEGTLLEGTTFGLHVSEEGPRYEIATQWQKALSESDNEVFVLGLDQLHFWGSFPQSKDPAPVRAKMSLHFILEEGAAEANCQFMHTMQWQKIQPDAFAALPKNLSEAQTKAPETPSEEGDVQPRGGKITELEARPAKTEDDEARKVEEDHTPVEELGGEPGDGGLQPFICRLTPTKKVSPRNCHNIIKSNHDDEGAEYFKQFEKDFWCTPSEAPDNTAYDCRLDPDNPIALAKWEDMREPMTGILPPLEHIERSYSFTLPADFTESDSPGTGYFEMNDPRPETIVCKNIKAHLAITCKYVTAEQLKTLLDPSLDS